jgi:hypothetical protein
MAAIIDFRSSGNRPRKVKIPARKPRVRAPTPEEDFEGLGQSVAPMRLKVARFNRCPIAQAYE